METIGWLGSVLLAGCGLPLAYRAYRNKHAKGVDWYFLLIWALGELLTLIYVIPKTLTPLLVNYLLNLLFISVTMYYKWIGENNESP